VANNSLIVPGEVAHFSLAYLALVFVPGYAMAVLARPRSDWIERLAFAIPCAYALAAVTGLATALLHLPFGLPTYGALALPITVAGGYSAWRRNPAPARGGQPTPTEATGFQPAHVGRPDAGGPSEPRQATSPDSAPGRWWLLPIGAAMLQTGTIIAVHAGDTVPPGIDAVMHVIWTNRIARSHVFPMALLSSHVGASDGGFYPPVFHALTALVLNAAPMAAYRAVFFSVVVATIPLPLALFSYVRTATGSARLGGLAALASLAFEPLPFFILAQSLYTLTVALLIVPALALALRAGLGEGDGRGVALAALLGVGLFYTHPTEFITAALLALAIVPGLLRNVRSWARALGYGAVIAAAWGLAAAPALAAVQRTVTTGALQEVKAAHDFTRPAHVDLYGALGGYVQWTYGRNISYLLLAAVAGGAIWCLARRRWLGLVAAQVIVFAVFVDTNTFNVLQRFYALSFPWAMGDRLPPAQYWLALPLAAIGIDATARSVRGHMRTPHPTFVAITALPFVLFGLILPLQVTALHTTAYAAARNLVAPSDLGAVAWLARHAPPGSVVIDDGDMTRPPPFDVPIDAGLWMPVLGGPQPLFWRLGAGPGPLDDRFYLLEHISDTPLTPRAAQLIAEDHVRYVFYGAHVLPSVKRHLSLARLLADPHLHLVYSSVAGCRRDDRADTRCPATGSYVFAIGDNGQPMGG
jgi:hypothetical protein